MMLTRAAASKTETHSGNISSIRTETPFNNTTLLTQFFLLNIIENFQYIK